MAEFTLVDSGLEFDGGKLRYAWFRLREPDGREVYRVVTWKELAYLPIEARQDPDVLGKQWAALRGLYNGRVDFVYTVLGAFRPVRLGVAQFYGTAAESPVLTTAAEEALARLAAVEAVLANFPHSRLRTPDVGRVQLLIERLRSLKRLLALLGHPDPRLSRKGLGRDGSLGEADDELASQQGEMLLRGLAKLREDFVFLVTAAHVPRPQLTHNLVRVAERASQFASRRRGAISASFSIAIPLAACEQRWDSLIVSSNSSFAKWTKMFGDPCLTSALLGRFHILQFRRKGYRFRQSLQQRAGIDRSDGHVKEPKRAFSDKGA